jgi:hypothetical protein
VTDVVGTYRTFLRSERELAAVEPLAADGTPSAPAPSGVTSIYRGRNGQPTTRKFESQIDRKIREQREAGRI